MPDKFKDTGGFVKWMLGIFASLILIGVMTLISQGSNINDNKTSCSVLASQQNTTEKILDEIKEYMKETRKDVKKILYYQIKNNGGKDE